MKLLRLIYLLTKIFFKYGNLEVALMLEITDPVRLQIEDPIEDIAVSRGDRVILIGPERLDYDS